MIISKNISADFQRIPLLLVLVALPLFVFLSSNAWEAQAQTHTSDQPAAENPNNELDRQRDLQAQELQRIQDEIKLGETRKQELADEIASLDKDRASLNRNLIETSAKTRDLEQSIDRTGNRMKELRSQETLIRSSLRGRRNVLAEILAALQRMGRKPPPAILVNPDDALSSVRSAILLGSVVPEIRQETEILMSELQDLLRVQTELEEQRATLTTDLASLAEQEERLNLLLSSKQEQANRARTQLASESARAAELAANARNLNRLIESLESEIASAREAAKAAELAEVQRKAREAERIASARTDIEKPDFSDTARIAPAVAFTKAKGLLPRPVNGVEVRSFGQKDAFGVTADGISIATRNNARVIAPADGWVVYAGPFRSYGQLMIINTGDEHHIVLAGMEIINARLGQFVLAGEPVGQMGSRRIASVADVDVGSSRPILYVEFRNDGHSIDPAPWWANQKTESTTDDT